MIRKEALVTGQYYHIVSRSIAGYKVFNTDRDYQRLIEAIRFYRYSDLGIKFSCYLKYSEKVRQLVDTRLSQSDGKFLVEIIAFCIMPTHIHLLLRQITNKGISIYLSNLLNSYTRYFNTKHKRKGPLWEGRFKNTLVRTDEQFLHLTRYIHLNPVSVSLVEKPEGWEFSSYSEYLQPKNRRQNKNICEFRDVIDFTPKVYQEFVEDRIAYQRELSKIKKLLLEDDTGF